MERVLDHVSHEGSPATRVVQQLSHTNASTKTRGEKTDYINPFEKRPWSLLIDSRKFHESPAQPAALTM